MPMANRAGRFRACVLDLGLSETGPSNLATVVSRFLLLAELVEDEWRDVQNEALEITAYVYLEKRDHSVNQNAVRQLQDAFGWDGHDMLWLEETQPLPECQVTLEYETYQGRERLKVQWINAYDSEPGSTVPHSTEDQRKRMQTRLGSKLRALAGGSPAARPAADAPSPATAAVPSAPAPTAPPKRPSPPTPAPDRPQITTMEDAWSAFCADDRAQGMSDAQIAECWWRRIEHVCGSPDADKVKPEQWASIVMKGPEIPF